MGTRSLAYVIDENKNILATIYKQYEGYPEGMGKDLYTLLAGRKLCNGFTSDDSYTEYSNGMGGLAAYLVYELKKTASLAMCICIHRRIMIFLASLVIIMC